jgi:hypothetical protein
VLDAAEIDQIEIAEPALASLDEAYLGPERAGAVRSLAGRSFRHHFTLEQALAAASPAWRRREPSPANQLYNRERDEQLRYVQAHFRAGKEAPERPPGPVGRRR